MDEQKKSELLRLIALMTQNCIVELSPEILEDVKLLSYDRAVRNQCYSNAGTYVSLDERARYVLGYYCVFGIPLEHAWVEIEGQHYDVTLKKVEEDSVYVKLIILDRNEMIENAIESNYFPDLFWMSVLKFTRSKKGSPCEREF
jgi:hypothetical protein